MTIQRSMTFNNRQSSKRTAKSASASRSQSLECPATRTERKRPRILTDPCKNAPLASETKGTETGPQLPRCLQLGQQDAEESQNRREIMKKALGNELDEWCRLNQRRQKQNLPSPTDPFSIFYSKQRPSFSISVYVSRLVHYIDASDSVFYTALLYMSRIQSKQSRLAVDELNVHRLLTTCIVLASKFLEDNVYTNKHYAQAGGLASVDEMNGLERSILRILDFNLNVSPEVYSLVQHHLARAGPFSNLGGFSIGDATHESPRSIHMEELSSFESSSSEADDAPSSADQPSVL